MYSHYGINFESKIKLNKLSKLLIDANNAEEEKRLWDIWVSIYPYMNKENFIEFNDFKNSQLSKIYTAKSYSEIENEMSKVVEAYEGR